MGWVDEVLFAAALSHFAMRSAWRARRMSADRSPRGMTSSFAAATAAPSAIAAEKTPRVSVARHWSETRTRQLVVSPVAGRKIFAADFQFPDFSARHVRAMLIHQAHFDAFGRSPDRHVFSVQCRIRVERGLRHDDLRFRIDPHSFQMRWRMARTERDSDARGFLQRHCSGDDFRAVRQ